jgi:hypothetical protein
MSGITAISSTTTHAASGADVSVAGYLTGDQIALMTSPTGTDYQWAISLPSGSNALRAGLAGDDTATASFTPDAPGVYAVSVTVDGTVYILRIGVTMLAQSTALEALRLLPVTDSQIATPSLGAALYYSSTRNALAMKGTDGVVHTVNLT